MLENVLHKNKIAFYIKVSLVPFSYRMCFNYGAYQSIGYQKSLSKGNSNVLYPLSLGCWINQTVDAFFIRYLKGKKGCRLKYNGKLLQTKRISGLMFLSLNLNGLFYHMQFPELYEPLNAISICSKSSKIEIFTRTFGENTLLYYMMLEQPYRII